MKEDINTHLAPLQWGVGAPRGCATIVNTLRTYIQRHPDHVILKCDISNAFNCQRRFAFLDAVQTSLPALLPLAAQFYIARTDLLLRGRSAADTCRLFSVSGQQQGDTLGSLLFSMGLQPVLQLVQDTHPTVTVRAYADDIHIFGPDRAVAEAFLLLGWHLKSINLQIGYGADKTCAWSPSWVDRAADAPMPWTLRHVSAEGGRVHECKGGMSTLGTFIGTDGTCQAPTSWPTGLRPRARCDRPRWRTWSRSCGGGGRHAPACRQ